TRAASIHAEPLVEEELPAKTHLGWGQRIVARHLRLAQTLGRSGQRWVAGLCRLRRRCLWGFRSGRLLRLFRFRFWLVVAACERNARDDARDAKLFDRTHDRPSRECVEPLRPAPSGRVTPMGAQTKSRRRLRY